MNDVIIKLSIASSLMLIIVYFKYKSSLAFAKLLLYYELMSLSIDLTSTFLLKHYDKSIYSYLIHLFFILEFFVFFYLFQIIFRKKEFTDSMYVFLFITSLIIYCTKAWSNLNKFNNIGSAYFYFILMVFCIIEFKKIISSVPHTEYIEQTSFFWILTGIFLYVSGCFVIFIFSDELMNKNYKIFKNNMWNIRNILNITKNICLSISITRKTER